MMMAQENGSSQERVLVIDDDADLCAMASDYLRMRGFTVESAGDGLQGLERAREGGWSMVILDVMLPQMDGFEVLRQLRSGNSEAARVPVVMLTAHGDETDRIVGLEMGADDYLPKPFNPRELLARMRAILRRVEAKRAAPREKESGLSDSSTSSTSPSVPLLQIGDMEVDTRARTVRCNGHNVELSATEFDLLAYLMREAGRVVGREELAREVLNRRLLSLDRSLDMHILKLRRKLGPLPDGGERVKTVRAVGYAFVQDAT